jgi:hypothetical protein
MEINQKEKSRNSLGASLSIAMLVLLVSIVAVLTSHSKTNSVQATSTSTQAFLPIIIKPFAWRPFNDSSPWNTPIGPNPEIDPNSSAMIATLGTSVTGGHFYINMSEWTIPVYYADAKTPTYNVPCIQGQCGGSFGPNVPIPDEAIPDPEVDGHMAVVDWPSNQSYEMCRAKKTASGWETDWGYSFNLGGLGVQSDGNGTCRGAGFPIVAGLIMLDQIKQGYINHALVMAYDYPRAGVYVYPASSTDGSGGPNAIPEGGYLQLDPNLDLNSLGLSPAGKTIARAMQEYGLYVGDIAGGIALYAEGLYGKPNLTWTGILAQDDVAKIPWQSFRVLKLPLLKQK